MSQKDFFKVSLKVIAFYFLINGLFHMIPWAFDLYVFSHIGNIILAIIALGILIASFFWLINSADNICNKLKLGDSKFATTITNEQLMQIAIIILSGLFFVSYLTLFILESFMWFVSNDGTFDNAVLGYFAKLNKLSTFDLFYWTNYLINLIIGYLIFFNYRWISHFLIRRINENDKGNTLD